MKAILKDYESEIKQRKDKNGWNQGRTSWEWTWVDFWKSQKYQKWTLKTKDPKKKWPTETIHCLFASCFLEPNHVTFIYWVSYVCLPSKEVTDVHTTATTPSLQKRETENKRKKKEPKQVTGKHESLRAREN